MSQHAYDDVEPDEERLQRIYDKIAAERDQLRKERDALLVERDKDYAGMREFQAKFIAADQEREKLAAEVARLREEVYALQADMNPEDVGRVMRALDAARKQGARVIYLIKLFDRFIGWLYSEPVDFRGERR